MTLYEYNLLPEKEKLNIIKEYGVDIAERYDIFHRYKLYQLFSFYTEVSFAEGAAMENYRSFSAEKLPEMYLEEIDISSLI
jgi:hypothetical protein